MTIFRLFWTNVWIRLHEWTGRRLDQVQYVDPVARWIKHDQPWSGL